MKCPKCGYTSFDHLTACRKCEHDLTEFRTRYGLGGRFQVALEKAENPVETDEPALAAPMESREISAAEATDFGFDFLNEDDENLSPGSTAEKLPSDPPRVKEDSKSAGELPDSIQAAESNSENSKDFFEDGDEDPNKKTSASSEADTSRDPFENSTSGENPEIVWERANFAPEGDENDPEWKFPAEKRPSESSLDKGERDDFFSWDLPRGAAQGQDIFASTGGTEMGVTSRNEGTDASFNFKDADLPVALPGDEEEDFAGLFLSSLDGSDNAVRKSLQEEPDSAPEFTTSLETSMRLPLSDPERDSLEEENGLMEEGPVTEEGSSLHAEAVETSGSFPAAPLLHRMGAGAADLFILSAGFGLFLLVGQFVQTPHGEDLIPSAEKLAQLAVPYFLVLFGLFFGYFTVFHFLTGQTPGKMLFRVRVESSDGEHISFSQAFLRSVGGLFSLLIAGIGFLLILLNSQRRGLNDLLAGSRVIFLGKDLGPGSGDPAAGGMG